MSSQVRKIFSDTVIYTVGSVFNRLLPFLLLPVYTLYFQPAEYGTFSLVYSFWFFIAVFYLYGMETSFQKYFIEAKTIEEKRAIYSSSLIMVFFSSVLFSAAVYFLAEPIALKLTSQSSNAYLIRLLAFILVIDALYRFPMILINSLQRSKLYSVINAFAVVLNVLVNIVLIIFLKMGIEAIFYSYLISYSFVFVISSLFSAKYLKFEFDLSKVKTLFKFAHQFLYYGLFLVSIDLVDRFILEYFKGSAEVGIYSACYRIGIVMNLVITGFKVAWTPFFLNLKDKDDNREIFSKVFTYFCFGGLIVFLAFSLLADDLVKVNIAGYTLLNENYWGGLTIIPYILLAYLFSGLYLNLNVASFFQNKIKYLIISSAVGCFTNIILNLILIPPFSIIGAAVATTVSYFLMFLVLYFYSQKIFRINYEWIPILKAVLLTAVLFVTNIYIADFINLSYIYTIIFKLFSVFLLFSVLLGRKSISLLLSYKAGSLKV